MKEYKVILYAEGIISSILLGSAKINPEKLTNALNDYAQQGWQVKTMEKEIRRTFLFFARETLVFVLERDKQ